MSKLDKNVLISVLRCSGHLSKSSSWQCSRAFRSTWEDVLKSLPKVEVSSYSFRQTGTGNELRLIPFTGKVMLPNVHDRRKIVYQLYSTGVFHERERNWYFSWRNYTC